jgi:outer membrane protein assembly factor BamD
MSKPVLALALLLAPLCAPLPGHAAVVYRSSEGWTVQGDPNSSVEIAAADLMRRGEEAEARGNRKEALSDYRTLIKRHGTSQISPKAQRKIGVLLEQGGEFDPAYEAYSTYLSKYPDGSDFDGVVDSMFRIAKLFLDGQKRKVFGVPFAPSMTRAQEMFEGIIKRAPFSRQAPLAQFNVGQCLEKQGKYPEAIQAYHQVVSKYPGDAIADDAQYQLGYVLLRQSREGSYDRAAAMKAREAFEDFINRYPESEKVPQARENMKGLQGGVVKGSLDVAKFYDKTKQYKAAVIYYNDVIKQQPGTPDADYAKARIESLREQVGEDALRAGPERSETGARAAARRKLQAKVDTASRPDYVGPPVFVPEEKVVETAPGRPKLRTSPGAMGPVPAVEPPLPTPDKLPTDETGLPKPPE